jgi:hypothetical protein
MASAATVGCVALLAGRLAPKTVDNGRWTRRFATVSTTGEGPAACPTAAATSPVGAAAVQKKTPPERGFSQCAEEDSNLHGP